MLIDRNDEKKYLDIWLTSEETAPDVSDYSQQFPGYIITIWHSGTQPLGQLTAELLRHNK